VLSGLPVISAGGDQNCAALGQGVYSAGTVVTNTGTGSYLIAHADQPTFDPGMRLACNASALPEAFIVEATLVTSGSIYRWFSERFYPAAGPPDQAFQEINAEAVSAPAGANGVALLPYFKGAGTPWWNPKATGTFLNLTLSTTRADMARAVLEGIAAEMKESLELIEELVGPVGSISASGGLTALGLYNQIQADMLEKPVHIHRFTEATALGAWVNAVAALGIHPSRPAAFEAVVQDSPPAVFTPEPGAVRIYSDLRRRRNAAARLLETSGYYDL
jgi:sugar (pentulose or hexulose) kinase